MVHPSVIEAKISQLGIRNTRWFRPEINELQHILMDDEEIVSLVTGRYFGGFAMLVATDHRLVLIDKKVLFLTVDDIRYDMISEIDFSSRLFDATLHIFTVNKQHSFTCAKHKHRLRQMMGYIQKRITEIRHYQPQQYSPPIIEHPKHPALPKPIARVASKVSDVSHQVHLPKNIGAAAMHGAHWMRVNPYTKNALLIRRRNWYGYRG